MSFGRWTMRGWACQAWACYPWALANGIVITVGTPSDGWEFNYTETVWMFGNNETVFTF